MQFAGTLSDGLGKTMDNRHQTERECIRYHGATSGEHLVAGIHGLAHGTSKHLSFHMFNIKTPIVPLYNIKRLLLYHDLSTEPNLPFHRCVGIIGGLTSVITSTVEGVKTEGGVSGFFSGLGKGLVGTVTKPVAGALDFASETAQTVREMASLSNRYFPLNYVFRLFFLF